MCVCDPGHGAHLHQAFWLRKPFPRIITLSSTSLQGRHFYPHFPDKEDGIQKVKNYAAKN